MTYAWHFGIMANEFFGRDLDLQDGISSQHADYIPLTMVIGPCWTISFHILQMFLLNHQGCHRPDRVTIASSCFLLPHQ